MINKEVLSLRLNIPSFYQTLIPSLKVNGKAEAMGLCPFHEDHNPSLSIDLNKGLFNCFSCGEGGDVFKFYQNLKSVNFQTSLREIAAMQGITDTPTNQKVVGTFQYQDAEGKTLYIKERIEPGRNGRSKEFCFKHQENGQWIKGRGCEPVPYNLPALIQSKYAFVVEGERKADLLMSWGLTAICLDSGANSPWREEYTKIFMGKEKVVILPDNDEPGQAYALKIAEALHGHVGEIKIVELPGLKEAEDVIDWARIEGNNGYCCKDVEGLTYAGRKPWHQGWGSPSES